MHYHIQTVVVAFILVTGALGSFLNVQNDCDFPVYCMGSRSDDEIGEATEIVEVAEGDSWTSPLESLDDNYGTALKCSPDPSEPDDYQYQMEMTIDGRTWVDLSIVNGDPFTDYKRAAKFPEMGGACPALECAPGENNCEWCPEVGQPSCDDVQYSLCEENNVDAWMYLCSYGN